MQIIICKLIFPHILIFYAVAYTYRLSDNVIYYKIHLLLDFVGSSRFVRGGAVEEQRIKQITTHT